MSYTPIFSEPTQKSSNNTHSDPLNSHSNSRSHADSKISRNGNGELKNNRSSSGEPGFDDYTLLVHCHLCWNWVWQRPQQFVSRLSKKRKVIFVETVAPAADLVRPTLRFRQPEGFPNITILTVQFPSWRWNDGAFVDKERRRVVKEFLASPMADGVGPIVQWFYDPMAVPAFAGQMKEVLTVYDCMDELSKFRCAPPEIIQREAD